MFIVEFYDEELEVYLDKPKQDGKAMPMRRRIFKIKEENFGMTRYFRLRKYNRSNTLGYTVKLNVWQDDIKLVDGATCTASKDGDDTVVGFVPTALMFPTPGDYDGELEFTKAGYKEDVLTFAVQVIPSEPV